MGETHVVDGKNLTELVESSKPVDHEQTKDRIKNMRKKTDLSDIILEKENSTNGRNKKMLMGAASLILLFLVFLIISKVLNSNTFDINNNDINSVVAKKSIDTNQIASSKNIDEKDGISDNMSNKDVDDKLNDTDLKFEEMVKRLREEDAKEESSDNIAKVVTPPEIRKIEEKKPKVETVEKIVNKPKKIETKKEKILITEVKKLPEKKQVVKPKIKRPNPNLIFGQNSGYYIQVGATTTPSPNRALVNKLISNNYSYITHPIVVKGRRFYKVLIGPFNSKMEAKAKLPRVRATINPQAFLYHLR